MKNRRLIKQCHICGDQIHRLNDKYWKISDPNVANKRVVVHRDCLSLDNARRNGIRKGKPDRKAERLLRFKTLNFYQKLTEQKQRREASRRLEISTSRQIKVVKHFKEQI